MTTSLRLAAAFLPALLLAALPAVAAEASPDEIRALVDKAPAHPRLLWRAGGEAVVREKVARDARLKPVHETIRRGADHMLAEPPVIYIKEGRRLLGRSREALARVTHLAYMARLTGDARYVRRATEEMQAAAAMPNWNPSHFLDTAEMTLALAIGYDWLFDRLTPEVRETVRTAIEKKGLAPYLGAEGRLGWERGGNNWNQVCHAGMVAGALALLEHDPARAVEVVARARDGVPYAMEVYRPDGTYPEGPGYWNYGTMFNVVLIQELETALGTDFGLSRREGFLKTGDFILHMTGPTRQWYPFSDCRPGGFSPALVWFAARMRRPDLLWFEERQMARAMAEPEARTGEDTPDRLLPLVVLWFDSALKPAEPAALDWTGQGINPVAARRSSWSDPNAVYLAIKAGSPGASHAHMDVGAFVLDADGVRWSLDLGAQSYHAMEARGLDIWNNQPGSDRWRIFRYHNRAHSTLMVDGLEQVVQSRAPLVSYPGATGTVVDLSDTYRGQLARAARRFCLLPDRRVVVEDRLEGGDRDRTVRWAMVTPARVKPDGPGRAWLEQEGRRLRLEVAGLEGAAIRTYPADPPPSDFDEPNPGVCLVGFEAVLPAGAKAEWRVVLTPGRVWKDNLPPAAPPPWPLQSP